MIVAAIAAAVGGGLPVSAPAVASVSRPPARTVRWVSAGDSYSSGEGISGVGRGDDSCARSPQAYGPTAARYLRDQRGWTIDQAIVACTGAVRKDYFSGADRPNGVNDESQAAQQAAAGMPRPDILTLSMGGNDLKFAEIIVGCLGVTPRVDADADLTWAGILDGTPGVDVDLRPAGCADPEDRARFTSDLTKEVENLGPKMAVWYRQVLEDHVAADGQLVVVGYPQLFADPSTWPAWRGHRCETVSAADANLLNKLTADLDEQLDMAAEEADDGSGRVEYVSLVEPYRTGGPGGRSRSLCSPAAATWMNGLSTDRLSQVLRDQPGQVLPGAVLHSFHPNALGHAATARLVAERIEETIGRRLQPPPPTTRPAPVATDPEPADDPPITVPPAFDPGDPFRDTCQVAWPTAPTRTTRAIQLTTTCQDVPGQFLFVIISYPDPDFTITPSRSRVEVEGTIVDIAESEYGYKTLLVEADDMALT